MSGAEMMREKDKVTAIMQAKQAAGMQPTISAMMKRSDNHANISAQLPQRRRLKARNEMM